MLFFEDPNVINLHNGFYLRVCDSQSQLLNKLGHSLGWIPNSHIKKELESMGKLPIKEHQLFEIPYKNSLLKIANA